MNDVNSDLQAPPNSRFDHADAARTACGLVQPAFRSVLALSLVLLISFTPSAVARAALPWSQEESASKPSPAQAPALLEVIRLGGLFSMPDAESSRLRLEVRIRLRNPLNQPFTPARESFHLLVNGVPGGTMSGSASKEIAPGDSADMQLIFTDVNPGPGSFPEPQLTLVYQPQTSADADAISVDLNEVLRKTSQLSSATIGPNGCATVIRINRDLDIPSIWLLHEHLQQILRTPSRRLVIAAENVQQRMHVNVFGDWIRSQYLLDSQGDLPEEQRLVDVRIAGFTFPGTELTKRRNGSANSEISFHNDTDDAIRQTLTPVYKFLPSHVVLNDILNETSTVKAAAAKSLDRLSTDQQQTLFNALLSDSNHALTPVVADLYRCSSPEVTDVLQKLATGEHQETAATAVACLAHSLSPEVQRVFEELWRTPDQKKAMFLQDAIVSATIDLDDHRWASFVSLWVETRLRMVATAASQPGGSKTLLSDAISEDMPTSVDQRGDPAAEIPAPAEPPEEPDAEVQASHISRTEIERLTMALAYLRAHGDNSALNIQRQWLLQISIPQIQDVVVQNIWSWQQAEDETLVREYIRARLNSGQITDTTRNAILIFPDREWADALLNDFRQVSNPPQARRRSLQSALRCSDTQTLDQLVSNIDSLDSQSQVFLLEHIAAVGYPNWHEVAEQLFQNNGPLFHQLMDILLADGSERSVLIMTRRLNQLITPEIGTRDITPENRMHAERLISRVSLFVHPEARRVLNRCARSADDIIRGRTQGAFAAAARRSPAEQSYTTAVTAFYAGQFAEALQAVDQAITLDELRASLYSLRGEILLRMNRTEEAAESLLHADFLNPESPAIWLQVALMKVAQEKPEQGIMLAESALALNDPDPQHFIAAAAVFAKAADKCKEDESARRAEYIDKSFALIQKAIELGFSNLSRLEHDPAFTSIMPDERWKPLSSR